ncbi:MAG: hypothetical protein LBD60_00040 [Puniceicoccales bacterium]|jgi:hypothetical protein|nr:hypothetical protein [Puniceicoccales bacterium]
MNKLKKLESSLIVGAMSITSSLLVAFGKAPNSYIGDNLGTIRNAKDEGVGKDTLLTDADRVEKSVIRLYYYEDKFRIYENIVLLKHRYGAIGEKFHVKPLPHLPFTRILDDFRKKEQSNTQNQSVKNEAGKQCEMIVSKSGTNTTSKWWGWYRVFKILTPLTYTIPTILETIFDYKIKNQEIQFYHSEEMAKIQGGVIKYFLFKVSNIGGGLCRFGGKFLDTTKSVVNNFFVQPGFWKKTAGWLFH